jgi:ABC-2 type transport system ATP-binding protein
MASNKKGLINMKDQESIIRVEGLYKTYGNVLAVDHISFEVQTGEIFGIVGPNGAGKTTTLESMIGLRHFEEGSVRVLNLDPQRQGRELRRRIGIQLQEAALPEGIRVWEALDLFASLYRHSQDWEILLETWGLAEKRNSLFSSLSGGQKQRLFISIALVNDPEVVFLDELTTGLDPQARRNTWGLIEKLREHGKTVILVTHFMEEAERLCSRVAIIDKGKLIALDSPSRLIQNLNSEIKVHFTLPPAFDPTWLQDVSGVSQIARQNGDVVVSGEGALLAHVAYALAKRGVIPPDLRSEQATLEDVFLTLTGQKMRD